MKYFVNPIGVIHKINGLYYLITFFNYNVIYKYFVTAIYDNKDNLIGCLDVYETGHIFNEKFDFNCYFIPILQTTTYCKEGILAYPWWGWKENKGTKIYEDKISKL